MIQGQQIERSSVVELTEKLPAFMELEYSLRSNSPL